MRRLVRGRAQFAMVAVAATAAAALVGAGTAEAAAITSKDVAIIGSPASINGGSLTTSGTGPTGSFSNYNFTNLAPANVTAAGLAPFDTAVLNVASSQMNCSTGTLSAASKTALNNFVGSGHKLVIYASECLNTDFTWLVFPFQSNNPGALGANGTLTDVEENDLSTTNPADSHYIDDAAISTQTDAVGDANVFTTFNPAWRVDMTAINANNVNGPVHTFARYSNTAGKIGLFIYNGLDLDAEQSTNTPGTADGSQNLSKVFLQELQQTFNPDNLPGSVAVVGITLNPPSATNPVRTSHTVTANVTDSGGTAQSNVLVTFTVTSGPNAGASGTCTSSTCRTNSVGDVKFTYTDTKGPGTDKIKACFTSSSPPSTTGPSASATSQVLCSQEVTKTWQAAADTTPPTCFVTATRLPGSNGKAQQDVTVQDTGSGLAAITNIVISNGTVAVQPFTPGTKNPVVVTATKTTPGIRTVYSFDARDVAGNLRHCT